MSNDEMVAGYLDGLNLDSPEPSANRSHAYRHGFANGRADRGGPLPFASAQQAREQAVIAMQRDAEA